MEKYHYDPEEYPNLKRLAGEMIPCLETEAGWQDRDCEETFPEGSTSKISSLQDTATAALIKNISIFFKTKSLLRSKY